jgi:hypothetical protein
VVDLRDTLEILPLPYLCPGVRKLADESYGESVPGQYESLLNIRVDVGAISSCTFEQSLRSDSKSALFRAE